MKTKTNLLAVGMLVAAVASGFTLQSTTNLADNNSWTTLTNVPVMLDSQNRVTDKISGPTKFYRLKK